MVLLLLLVLALVIVTVAVAYWVFLASIEANVGAVERQATSTSGVITEESIAALPEPAQRYLRHAGVIGKAIPRIVHLSQTGRIRSSAAAAWMSFEALETYSTNPPAFVWRAYFPTRTMPLVLGRDLYHEGTGSILMRMLAILPIADEHGDELRAAGLMRYLNEMSWFPAAFLGDNVQISARDENSFLVRITDRALTAEAIMFIDGEGQMTNFEAQRFNTASHEMQKWETPIVRHADYAGFNLPSSGSAVWRSPEGDLTYIELDVAGVSYEY